MPGEAIVTIKDRQWSVAIANTYAELTSGLSEVESIPLQTGVLFDLGYDQKYIEIDMSRMLFALDIVFINSTQGVVGALHNVQPALNATFHNERLPGARCFLEVNVGEAEGIAFGDEVAVQGYTAPTTGIDITTPLMNMMMPVMFMVMMMKVMDRALAPPKAKPKLPPGYVYLPASEDAEHLLRRLDAEQKDLWNRACEWDKIPRDSKFASFSPDNPYAKKQNDKMAELMKYRRLIQAGGGLKHRIGPQSLSSTWSRSPQTNGNKPHRSDVSVESRVERDRLGIWVKDNGTGQTLIEWWDEDAAQMFEDGWFKPGTIKQQTITGRDFEQSVLDYLEYIGVLDKSGRAGVSYLPQTVERDEVIEIPFKESPEWVQSVWKRLHGGTVPRVKLYRTTVARIHMPFFEYAVRDIVAHKAGQTMSRYVPSYESLLSSSPEEKALYFGGAVTLRPDEMIAVMDFWGDRYKHIDLYAHPTAYEPPKLVAPTLTDRQMKILATIRGSTSAYRKGLFQTHKVTQAELDEIQRMGLIDRRGAITVLGRNVAGKTEPLKPSYLLSTKSEEVGTVVGSAAGGAVGGRIAGPKGAAVGVVVGGEIGKTVGGWLGKKSQRAKLSPDSPEGNRLLDRNLFPQRTRVLDRLAEVSPYTVVEIHDDGDLTIKWKGANLVVTTEGKAFREIDGLPAVIPTKPSKMPTPKDDLEYLPDSPEFLTQTIDAIGYRDKLDSAFQEAIARAKGLK